jgi:hypothetical protein
MFCREGHDVDHVACFIERDTEAQRESWSTPLGV